MFVAFREEARCSKVHRMKVRCACVLSGYILSCRLRARGDWGRREVTRRLRAKEGIGGLDFESCSCTCVTWRRSEWTPGIPAVVTSISAFDAFYIKNMSSGAPPPLPSQQQARARARIIIASRGPLAKPSTCQIVLAVLSFNQEHVSSKSVSDVTNVQRIESK